MTDPTYIDLARSILEHGTYQVAFSPQTTLPPGLPLILAVVGRLFGFAQPVLYLVIALSATLGLIASYELLRRVEGRGIAAASCLLLASSPAMFSFNAVLIYPEMPYLLMSMAALLLALKVDQTGPGKVPIGALLIFSLTLVMAVLIRSVGVALVAGLVTWIIASLWVAPESGRRRMRLFLVSLLLALIAQLSWSVWAHHHQVLQWQLPGYPESYLSQLKVKNGQYPELGLARLSDIPARLGRNIVMQAAGFSQFLLRRNITQIWCSPMVFGVLMLVAVGLWSSLLDGGQLHDWYFLWYEFILMVWPWDFKVRFLFPVVPLACLYLWRGGEALKNYSMLQPRTVGAALVLSGSFLSISSGAFAFGLLAVPGNTDHAKGDHLQTIVSTLFWGIVALVGFAMLRYHSLSRLRDGTGTFARLSRVVQTLVPSFQRFASILIIFALVGSATAQLVVVGRHNLNPDITQFDHYPEFEAANWVRFNEPSSLVVMDREPEFVFHFTNRRVIWFPPISDPKVLMDGIRRHHVGLIIVSHHPESYWLPAEEDCFRALQEAYPSAFHLAHHGLDSWVYEMVPPPDGG